MSIPAIPIIGFRHPSWSRYWQSVLPGVVDHCKNRRRWHIQTEENSYGEMEAVTIDKNWIGDGAILFRATEEELVAFKNRGMAVVLTSSEGPDCGFPRVIPDNFMAGVRAAEHLLEKGILHFAYLARGETLYQEQQFAPGQRVYSSERLAGFRQRLQSERIEPSVTFLKGYELWQENAWQQVLADVKSFLNELPQPCGLFVVDDSLAAVVLRAASELGILIPEQLMVVSFGDDPMFCFSHYRSLSSIAYPGKQVGMIAATLIDQQLRGLRPAEQIVRIPVSDVIQRESTDGLALKDVEIAKAIAWIRRQAPTDPLQVSEVEAYCGLSSTMLNARFRAAIGHSPKQEIMRVRLQRLKHLLQNTELSITEITAIMRFNSAHELGRFFFNETGQRPVAWREEQQNRAK